MPSFEADMIASQRERVRHALRAALDRENASTRCCAVRAMQELDVRDESTRKKLLALLVDPDPDVRTDTAIALGNLKYADSVVPLLKNIEEDPEGEVRIQATIALGRIGSADTLPSLTRCIKREGYPELDFPTGDTGFSTCWEVQRHALEALEKIDCPKASQDLQKILQDENYDYLRGDGYRVLMNLDPHGSNQFLLDQYEQGDTSTRIDAMRALGLSTGTSNFQRADLRGILLQAMADDDARLRREAVKTATALFAQDSGIIQAVASLLQDPDEEVRQAVMEKLAGFKSDELLDILHELTERTQVPRLTSLIRLVGTMGDDSSAEIISRFLIHEDDAVRYAAVEALANIAVPVATEELLWIASDTRQSDLIRLHAIRALASTYHLIHQPAENVDTEKEGDQGQLAERVVDLFEHAVHDDSERVGFTALSALTELNPDRAEEILLYYLNGKANELEQTGIDPSPGVAQQENDVAPKRTVSLEELLPYLPEEGSAESSTLGSIFHRVEQQALRPKPEETVEERTAEPESSQVPDRAALLAIRLLGGLRSCSEETIARLLEAGAEESLRIEVIRTIDRLGDCRGLPLILDVLERGQLEERVLALDAMCSMSRLEDSTETLNRLVDDEDPVIREKALLLFASIGGGEAASLVEKGLTDANVHVCKAALAALNTGNSTADTAELLFELMFRHGCELRTDIAAALMRLGDNACAERLMEMLCDESQDDQHWICIEALSAMFSSKNLAA